MGLTNWARALLLKRKIQKIHEVSPVERSVDGILAEELKTMTATNRTIDKLLKVKIMRQQTQHSVDKLRELDEELEEEVEEGEDFEGDIKKIIFEKILKGVSKPPQETGGSEGNFGVPVDPVTDAAPTMNPILDAIGNATPEQIEAAKKAVLG